MLAIHLATIVIFGYSTYIIYRLGSHLADERARLIVALLFIVYNVCFNPIWCFSSLPESFYVFLNTLGIDVLLKHEKKSAFFSGMILAFSCLFKQNELLIILTTLIYLTVFPTFVNYIHGRNRRRLSGAFLILVWQFTKSHFIVRGGAILTIDYISTQKLFNIRRAPRGNTGSGEKYAQVTFTKEKCQGLLLIIIWWPLLYRLSFFLPHSTYPHYLPVLLPPLTVLAEIRSSLLRKHFHDRGRQLAALLLVSAIILSYQQKDFPVMDQALHYIIIWHHKLSFFNRIPTKNYNSTPMNEVINHTDKLKRVLLWEWYSWANVLADRRFIIGLLEMEILADAEKDLEFYQYL